MFDVWDTNRPIGPFNYLGDDLSVGSYYTLRSTVAMRACPILRVRLQRWVVSAILTGMLAASVGLHAQTYAERIEPQIEMETSDTLDTESTQGLTPATELDDQWGTPELQVAMPKPDPQAIATLNDAVPTIKGKVDIDKEFVPDVDFGDTHVLSKGETLVLTMMDMVATGYSQNGDTFHARLRHAVERDGKVLVPKGTLFRGRIVQEAEPGKNFSRRGKIVLAFDYILMPDGRKVPLKSEYTKGDNALKAVGRTVGSGIGGTVGGAIQGVLLGLRFGGLQGAAATNGATLIAGGGLGAVAGLGRGLSQSGDHILLDEGNEIKVALQEPLTLPALIAKSDLENEVHAQGLNVKITNYALGRDPFRVEKLITLKLQVDNQTSYKFGSFDMALMDEYGSIYSLSPFNESSMLVFQVEPNSQFKGEAAFSVQSPDLKHYLVFYKPYTREILAKISLTEALKNLSSTKPVGKRSSRRG